MATLNLPTTVLWLILKLGWFIAAAMSIAAAMMAIDQTGRYLFAFLFPFPPVIGCAILGCIWLLIAGIVDMYQISKTAAAIGGASAIIWCVILTRMVMAYPSPLLFGALILGVMAMMLYWASLAIAEPDTPPPSGIF